MIASATSLLPIESDPGANLAVLVVAMSAVGLIIAGALIVKGLRFIRRARRLGNASKMVTNGNVQLALGLSLLLPTLFGFFTLIAGWFGVARA